MTLPPIRPIGAYELPRCEDAECRRPTPILIVSPAGRFCRRCHPLTEKP